MNVTIYRIKLFISKVQLRVLPFFFLTCAGNNIIIHAKMCNTYILLDLIPELDAVLLMNFNLNYHLI